MKHINSYIIEKLIINKDSKEDKKVNIPLTKEEFIDFINKYFEEWYFSDPKMPKTLERNKKYFEDIYNYIIKYTKDKYFSVSQAFNNVLPVKFIKYMNDKYDLNYKLK